MREVLLVTARRPDLPHRTCWVRARALTDSHTVFGQLGRGPGTDRDHLPVRAIPPAHGQEAVRRDSR
jgi:hypothetical protein